MSSSTYENSDYSWEQVKENFGEYNTETALEQLEFVDSADVMFSDGTETRWKEAISEKYRKRIEELNNPEQYGSIEEDGSVTICVGQENELLFILEGEERKEDKTGVSGLLEVAHTLAG